MPDNSQTPRESPSWSAVLGSVLRAGFGVQNERARQRDFTSRDPRPFIIVGIIVTIGLVLAVVLAVRTVLATST